MLPSDGVHSKKICVHNFQILKRKIDGIPGGNFFSKPSWDLNTHLLNGYRMIFVGS